ncbi:MAG: hypothetical protein COA78_04805 [Blastopirellula sp.]|nr:MAG: hypothetical protein COA78_04805 [Blastopirellula sp.]
MFSSLKNLWFLAFALFFAFQASLEAGHPFRGHWYHDPVHPHVSSLSATRAGTFSSQYSSSSPTTGAGSQYISSGTNYIVVPQAQPGNAILRLFAERDVMVLVNGTVSKQPVSSKYNQTCREFSLNGLSHEQYRGCDIEIHKEMNQNLYTYKHSFSVLAGGHYEIRFPRDFTPVSVTPIGRVQSGLQALYTFNEITNNVIKDRSNSGKPLDLTIDGDDLLHPPQGLIVNENSRIKSNNEAKELTEAVKKSNEITIETWIQPNDLTLPTNNQPPARIVTLSKDTADRNFTLGQNKDKFVGRLRTTTNGTNGSTKELISPSNSVKKELLHVVYSRDKQGISKLYINGQEQLCSIRVDGNFSNWDDGYRLALGNEVDAKPASAKDLNDRTWTGVYYLVAIYSKALTKDEVQQNFKSKF